MHSASLCTSLRKELITATSKDTCVVFTSALYYTSLVITRAKQHLQEVPVSANKCSNDTHTAYCCQMTILSCPVLAKEPAALLLWATCPISQNQLDKVASPVFTETKQPGHSVLCEAEMQNTGIFKENLWRMDWTKPLILLILAPWHSWHRSKCKCFTPLPHLLTPHTRWQKKKEKREKNSVYGQMYAALLNFGGGKKVMFGSQNGVWLVKDSFMIAKYWHVVVKMKSVGI